MLGAPAGGAGLRFTGALWLLASTTTVILVDDLLDWVDNMAMTWESPWRLGNDAPGPMA